MILARKTDWKVYANPFLLPNETVENVQLRLYQLNISFQNVDAHPPINPAISAPVNGNALVVKAVSREDLVSVPVVDNASVMVNNGVMMLVYGLKTFG